MSYLNNFNLWKTDMIFDEETKKELSQINDNKEIEDRFYKDLEFGTAGLRGVMGAGTNRMNKYTVGKATTGFANYLLDVYGKEVCKTRGVVVAYDTRNNSETYAHVTADVFSAKGIRVHFLKKTSPIPVLSYTIRTLNAVAGVVVTASHNPREYNGYKAYDETGCQLNLKMAEEVTAYVNKIENYSEINFNAKKTLIKEIDLTDEFIDEILKQSRFSDENAKSKLQIVYTPLHGSGYVPVCKALAKDGFSVTYVVEEQAQPNGNFPTVSSPNPENRDALEMGIAKAEKLGADIVLGTDPDADRVGVAVRTEEGYKLLTGNQVGVLLIDYLISKLNRKTMPKPIIIKTIVTSELGAQIARKNDVLMISVLTGFKFIGEKITQFAEAKKAGDKKLNYDYLLGFEESYGYLIGTHARDKDAVVACVLISEMAAELKTQGKTLVDKLNELYKEYGYFVDTQDNITLKGKDGLEKINSMMKTLREVNSPFNGLKEIIDYKNPVLISEEFGYLPTANVVKFVFDDDSWIAVRPSGTEPKIKIYYSIKGKDETEANEKLEHCKKTIKKILGI